jgi:2-polyprenyl-6-hydroxyphenyl methylase/3-demethylubiquinone-9 3-methyltransferase
MINNQFYDELGDDWIERFDHPVALLRRENAIRTPWVIQEVGERIVRKASVLDIGCGAGLLANPLAEAGHFVTGVDLSESSLKVAKKWDSTGQVQYFQANAYSLPFPNHSFDVVCAMDILEHVEEPYLLIAEASRVLKTGGFFFFHTFNRNPLSYLTVIKGIEWFVKNTPPNLHVYPLFITPDELEEHFEAYKLKAVYWVGLAPKIFSLPMLKMLFSGSVPSDFAFQFTRSLLTGYCGIAEKQAFY